MFEWSPDRRLSFALRRRPAGVWVQRRELRSSGSQVLESLLFADVGAFMAWCGCDPMRFTYPLLFSHLSRRVVGLFDDGD